MECHILLADHSQIKVNIFRETGLFEMFIQENICKMIHRLQQKYSTSSGTIWQNMTKSFIKACNCLVLLPFTLQTARDSPLLLINYKAMLIKRLISYLKLSKALVDYFYLSALPISFLPSFPSPIHMCIQSKQL